MEDVRKSGSEASSEKVSVGRVAVKKKKPLLRNWEKRLMPVKLHKNWTANQGQQVIWSAENFKEEVRRGVQQCGAMNAEKYHLDWQ